MTGEEVLPPENGPHLKAVADVLMDLSLDIEMLGTVLCGNAEVVQRHMQELQTIDMIAQKQRSLANVLRSDCPRSALSDISLEELRLRLHELVERNRPKAGAARPN
jgi:hypothetical protein